MTRSVLCHCLYSISILWPRIETHGGTATPAKLPKQALDSILEALKSEGQGAWVVEVMRRGFDDVIEVEIASNAQGQRGGGQQDPLGIAALQKNLLAQLVQACL